MKEKEIIVLEQLYLQLAAELSLVDNESLLSASSRVFHSEDFIFEVNIKKKKITLRLIKED
jgi:hypothetical protein